MGIASLVPQVYKTVKTKDVDSYSLVFVVLGLLSNSCWVLNGLFYTNDIPVVLNSLNWVIFYIYLIYLIIGQRVRAFVRGEARDVDIFSYFV